ncbi:O-antigen ligase family protein [Caldifermentibacillus hisashii]|uniref:O-antigen ligase family protein n=1 Tax=Caldifermentibacillus hisashii TaxID=996558 RepID=UPI0031FBF9D3
MNSVRHPSNVLLLLIILLLVAPIPGILFGPLSIRLIDLSILFLGFLALFYFLYNTRISFKSWATVLTKDKVLIFIALSSISVIISTIAGSFLFPKETSITDLYELYRYAFYLVFYFLACYIVKDIDQTIDRFANVLFITIIIIQLFGIFQFFNIFNINNNFGLLYTQSEHFHNMIVTQHRISSTFANPNTYGSFLIIVLSVLLSINYIKKQTFNWLIFLTINMTLFSIIITTSRTTLITTFGLIIYAGIMQIIVRISPIKHIILKTLVVLLSFLLVVALLVPKIPYLSSAVDSVTNSLHASEPAPKDNSNNKTCKEKKQPNNNNINKVEESLKTVESYNLRQYYWNENLQYFYDSPIVGAGPMKNGIAFADNAYIYILARYGIIGTLIYAGFFIYSYFKSFAISFKKEVNTRLLIIASTLNYIIVAYSVMGLTLESWFNIDSMILFFLLLGLLKNQKGRQKLGIN